MDEEKRNVILFFAISMLIMLGYPYVFNSNTPNDQTVITQEIQEQPHQSETAILRVQPQQGIEKFIKIDSASISGSISTLGGAINKVYLKNYNQTIDSQDPSAVFDNDGQRYSASTGWFADDHSTPLPDDKTCWFTDSSVLSENSPVTLTWDNGNGLIFEKTISIDDKFLITIEESVKNYGHRDVYLKPASQIYREFAKKIENNVSFYEGPLGYLNGKLEEISYEDIQKSNSIAHSSTGGWFGVTDKYWLVAVIPNQNAKTKVTYKHIALGQTLNAYAVESAGQPMKLPVGQSISYTHHVFTGAKEVNTLDMYESKLGIQHFDLAIDFGCLYILTKPLLYALAYTKDLVGNMGLGIILITLLLKLLLLPFANRSYKSMNRMKVIQPKIQELQKRYADDKAKLGQAVSELYKKENINPVGGCLPLLIQSPILFALYKVLYISIEMRQAPFCLWIQDLSMPDPCSILNLFGLLPFSLPSFLQIGIWPMIMGLSMFIQQKMNPAPTDPAQEKMLLIMPIMFTFMFAQLPAGLIIYWTFSNVLGIIQQYVITKSEVSPKKAK